MPDEKIKEKKTNWKLIGLVLTTIVFTLISFAWQIGQANNQPRLHIVDIRVKAGNHMERYDSRNNDLQIIHNSGGRLVFSHTAEVVTCGIFDPTTDYTVTYSFDTESDEGEWTSAPIDRGTGIVQRGKCTRRITKDGLMVSETNHNGVWIKDFLFTGI